MSEKSFQFVANTINGEIQEFPPTLTFKCGSVEPIGVEIIRQCTIADCIENIIVFLIRQGSNVFGSTAFKSTIDFINYVNSSCACCPETHCYLLINGCYARVNGFTVCLR